MHHAPFYIPIYPMKNLSFLPRLYPYSSLVFITRRNKTADTGIAIAACVGKTVQKKDSFLLQSRKKALGVARARTRG